MRSFRDPNRRPTHPGELLREDVLPALGMTQTEFAERLAVSRLTVSELLHGKRALSADMALRLARLLGTTPESWLNMQQMVDLWELEHEEDGKYRHIKPLTKAAAEGTVRAGWEARTRVPARRFSTSASSPPSV
jgi:antitoxin HigA-1